MRVLFATPEYTSWIKSGGLVDNKICAVDADWSALRFVLRTVHRAALRNG